MIEVVRINKDSISVRDDKAEGLSICFKCRGFRTISVFHCCTSWFWLGYDEVCSWCKGQGLFWGVEG